MVAFIDAHLGEPIGVTVLALGAAMMALALALAAQAQITGFPAHVMAMVQVAILVVFASVGFAGTFRLFLLWALALLGAFGLWLATRDVAPIAKLYTLTNFSTFFIFALYFNWDIERRARKVFAAGRALEAERAKTEELLYNVLPREVAARLRSGEAVADSFSDVTVVFVDMVDFSGLAKRLAPGHLVETLNAFFSAADRCAERHGLEKVKTIGDAFLAVAGGTGSRDAGPAAALDFARALVGELAGIAARTGVEVEARVGIHTGPAVGGVIGSSRLAYDYWGDTLNLASRLQAAAPVNGVAVSEAVWFRTKGEQDYEARSTVLKGIGEAHEPETHLIPLVLEVAAGLRPQIAVFGDRYASRILYQPVDPTVSEAVRAAALAQGFPAERMRTHYLGVDLTRFAAAATPEGAAAERRPCDSTPW